MYLQKYPFSNFWYLYVHIYGFSFLQLIYLYRKCFNMHFISIYMINSWYNEAIFSAVDFRRYFVVSRLQKITWHGLQILLSPLTLVFLFYTDSMSLYIRDSFLLLSLLTVNSFFKSQCWPCHYFSPVFPLIQFCSLFWFWHINCNWQSGRTPA